MLDAIIQGFYTKLATYSETNEAYHIIAPQDASLPYITFGLETDVPIGEFGNLEAIEDLTFWVNCFSETGQKAVGVLADAVLAVMDDCELNVDSYTHLVCRREFIGSFIFDIETKIYQVPIRYRVWLNKD